MNGISPYYLLIALSVIIILSYFFNILAKRTNIPSVLSLIILGIIISVINDQLHVIRINLFPVLEVLGIVGLIMIVLEAALDLKLEREKWPILWRSFSVALLSLVATSFAIAALIHQVMEVDWERSLLYAIRMSVLSSAIVLPSVNGLSEERKEFMIYDSTFSDILGIMFFYLMVQDFSTVGERNLAEAFSVNVGITIAISIIASYVLVLVFQNIKSNVKLFLLISVLILLYSVAKLLHFSSLLIILVFGLVLNNPKVFFIGPLQKLVNEDAMKRILTDFSLITIESAFVVRTLFFVIFGSTIILSQLLSVTVFLESIVILLIMFGIRWLFLRIFVGQDIFPQVFIAPRGLITILLFFAIPKEFQIVEFENGILLYIILATTLLITWSLIRNNSNEPDDYFNRAPSFEDDVINDLVSENSPTISSKSKETNE